MEPQFKRNIAYKFRIGDVLIGKPILDQERLSFLEFGNKRIVRVNLVGNIIDRYQSEGESKYLSLTLDDGSGQIKLKSFGDDSKRFDNVTLGQTVLIIGVVRIFNNEIYVSPEIIKLIDPRYLLVRKIEIEKERNYNQKPIEREQIIAIKDRILDLIKNAESEGGMETDEMIMKLRETSPEIINQEIKKLLEDGIIFEPRPGKVRWLG